MRRPRNIAKNRAVTLVELMVALALGALILASLATILKVGMTSWKEGDERNELIQHARVAMARMISELRYAENGVDFDAGVLEFDTTNLIDDDAGTERLKYELSDMTLYRSVDGSSRYEIAGSSDEGIFVSDMTVTPFKLSSGNLVGLDSGDNPSTAIAARIDLTLQDSDGDEFSLSSFAKFRNR